MTNTYVKMKIDTPNVHITRNKNPPILMIDESTEFKKYGGYNTHPGQNEGTIGWTTHQNQHQTSRTNKSPSQEMRK